MKRNNIDFGGPCHDWYGMIWRLVEQKEKEKENKGMTLTEAVEKASRTNQKIRRKYWVHGFAVVTPTARHHHFNSVEKGEKGNISLNYSFTLDDVLSTDWEVVEESLKVGNTVEPTDTINKCRTVGRVCRIIAIDHGKAWITGLVYAPGIQNNGPCECVMSLNNIMRG